MKSKTTFIILIIALVLIILFMKKRSATAPLIKPTNTNNTQSIESGQTTQNNINNEDTASINTDLQSLDNIVNGISNDDFAVSTLDGIE